MVAKMHRANACFHRECSRSARSVSPAASMQLWRADGNRGARRGHGGYRRRDERRRGMRTSRASSRRASPPTRSRGPTRAGTSSTANCRTSGRRPCGATWHVSSRARTHAGVRSGRPHAGAAARARLPAGRDRGRTLLGEGSRMAVPQPGVLLGFLDPEIYLSKPYAPLEQRMRAYIAYAREIPRVAAEIRANLRTPMPAPWIDYGVNAFGGFAEFFSDGRAAVSCRRQGPGPCKRQLGTGQCRRRHEPCRALADWLAAERPRADAGFCARARSCSRACSQRPSRSTAARAAVGNRPRRPRAQPRRRCASSARNYAPGKTLRAMRRRRPTATSPKAVPSRGARRQLPELKAFVQQKGLVTIPGPEEALVDQAPPYNAQNFAYIITAGPYETKNVPSVYYIAPPDPRWTPEEQAQYVRGEGTLLSTSVHEVWPGHFLHFLHVEPQPVARSRSCSRAMRTPKAGRITPRK